MVLLGVDVHKDTHTVVAADQAGRQLAVWAVGTRDRDLQELPDDVIPGRAALTAAKITDETGNPRRQRQLNAAVHRIALTQMRIQEPGRAYYLRRRSQGDTAKEALRALKRRITRRVFVTLVRSTQASQDAGLGSAAA